MNIVENIRSLCISNGTSIPKLEKILSFGNGAIYNWDKNSPSLDKLQKVASYFKVTVDDIIGWGSIYDIGWAVEDERQHQSITLEELAIQTNIDKTVLSQIEEDLIPLTSEQLKSITDFFEMTVQDFLVKYEMYDEAIHEYFKGDADAYLEFEKAKHKDAMQEEPETIAAHMDDDLSEEEMENIKEYIQFIKSKRK